MEEIDLKDRKILYYLSADARQSLTHLGKKVGLSRELVKYRIKRLQEKGVIKNFITITDSAAFGTTFIRFYYTFQNTTPAIKKDIINFFINHKKSIITKLIEARYDLEVQYFFKNVSEFRSCFHAFKMRFGDYILREFFSTQLSATLFDYIFLLEKKKNQKRQSLEFKGEPEIVTLDSLDVQLLRIININARMPITDIAKKMHTTSYIVNAIIKKLKKKGVIKGFSLDIDFSKLGYYFFHVDISLRRYNRIYELIEYVKKNPFLYCIENNIGLSDISLQFYLKDVNQLHEILEDISVSMPDTIKNYKYHRVIKEYPRQFITI